MQTIEIVQGHCPECGPDRECDVLYLKQIDTDEPEVWYIQKYFVLQCRGCKKVHYRTESICSDECDYPIDPHTGEEFPVQRISKKQWPAPPKCIRPAWFDRLGKHHFELYQFMHEVYCAIDNDLNTLAAMGLRSALEWASRIIGVSKDTFSKMLKELEDLNLIDDSEKSTLKALTEAGNAATHRSWNPSDSQISTMTAIVENFIERRVILDAEASKLAQNVPQRVSTKKIKTNNEKVLPT
ncbi:DUF4145 domain-containing protein [Brucella intermedia]|uniref:DUF4145 domain-containing protein n=1 Tax=Brucella intermedia TaxID=94625 RepID=UPI00209B8436|nr:DUF4145 domain-containing protein [Brucella intermedia]MCO7728856.1 DUF4145 domain-containing protein [Brucella intermedia]